MEKLIRLPLGRNRARPSYTVARGPRPQRWLGPCAQRARPTATALARPGCTARAAHGLPGRPRPARPVTARRGTRAHAGAVTALRARVMVRPAVVLQWQRWSKRRCSSTHGGEATRRAWERKSGSAAAFSNKVRAPMAGGGPATGRRERVSGGGAETTMAPGGTAQTGDGGVSAALGQQWG
jgi:hypothetical protein